MSGSINKVTLLGHLGRDPEIRHTQSGDPIANFSIATSESWTDKSSGERKERTDWHNVVVFNDGLAGIVEKYLRKGSKVYVEGRLQTREYQDKDGQRRFTTEVVLQKFRGEIILLDSQSNRPPPASDPDAYGATTGRGQTSSGQHSSMKDRAPIDDDIPF